MWYTVHTKGHNKLQRTRTQEHEWLSVKKPAFVTVNECWLHNTDSRDMGHTWYDCTRQGDMKEQEGTRKVMLMGRGASELLLRHCWCRKEGRWRHYILTTQVWLHLLLIKFKRKLIKGCMEYFVQNFMIKFKLKNELNVQAVSKDTMQNLEAISIICERYRDTYKDQYMRALSYVVHVLEVEKSSTQHNIEATDSSWRDKNSESTLKYHKPLVSPAAPVSNPFAWAISRCANSQSMAAGRSLSASGFLGFRKTYIWLEPEMRSRTLELQFSEWNLQNGVSYRPKSTLSLCPRVKGPVKGAPFTFVLAPGIPGRISKSDPFLVMTAWFFIILQDRWNSKMMHLQRERVIRKQHLQT